MYNQNVKGKGVYMHVNSVSSVSQSFGNKKNQQKQFVQITPEQFANMSDRDLEVLAKITASNQVNDKKHVKINKAMYYNLPLAGGLAALAVTRGSRLGKLAVFAGSVLGWGAGLFAIDTMLKGKHVLERKSANVRDFNKKHPMASTALTIGGLFAGLIYGGRGISKLAAKVLPKLEKTNLYTKYAPKITDKALALGKSLKANKVLDKISALSAKVPSSIKSIGRRVAVNAPFILVGTQLAHSFTHRAARNQVTMDNFAKLKEAQIEVRNQLEDQEFKTSIM